MPVDAVSYSKISSFIEKLNNETKLNFSLPSAEQWKYAAKGGNKSQNYTYAGSNTPGDVAWYAANCTSKQKVKTKAPNELGIYDMSGNVGEIRLGEYYDNGYYYIDSYGGNYKSSSSSIGINSYVENRRDYTFSGVGFRLILTCK